MQIPKHINYKVPIMLSNLRINKVPKREGLGQLKTIVSKQVLQTEIATLGYTQ